MKKLLYKVSASLCIALAATSCLNDLLEVESQSSFDQDFVFSDYTMAEYNVFAIADYCGATNGYRGRLDLWYGFNTDIELYSSGSNGNSSWATNANLQLSEYNSAVNNGTMNTNDNGYVQFFNAIEVANICIEGLSQYAAEGADPDMAYLLGESLTWRAFLYSELVKMWGEAPLRTTPVAADNMYLPKTNRDNIYEQCLKDLEQAYKLVYEPFKSTQTQTAYRVNKATVAGLYARIALAATGYAWRPDDDKLSTGDNGSLRRSNSELFNGENKDKLYQDALTKLEEAMHMGNSLETSYEQLWRKFNNSDHITSAEVLWVRPYSNGRGRWNYTHAGSHAGSEYISGGDRGGSTGPNPTLWWKYGKNDTRRDMTCVPWYYNNSATAAVKGWQLRGRANYWYWGKYRFEWMFANPYTGGNDDGVKPIVLRFSDIYLMAAELALYTGNTAKAKEYLGKVRERAYGANYEDDPMGEAYVNGLTEGSKDPQKDYNQDNTILKAIIDERALEFAGEMLRKQDLIRWGLLKVKLDEAAADLQALAEMTGPYEKYRLNGGGNLTNTDLDAKNAENVTVPGMNVTGDGKVNVPEYQIYWREVADAYPATGYKPVEIFGLDDDEIGKEPEDFSKKNSGWEKTGFLSVKGFYNKDNDEYRYQSFYRNAVSFGGTDEFSAAGEFGNPWPRSVWPHYTNVITLSQGALVNDYGY